MQQLQQSI
jgi:hypothetical protein